MPPPFPHQSLVHDYGWSGVAFHIYRPVLRHLKPRPTPSKEGPRHQLAATGHRRVKMTWKELPETVRGMLLRRPKEEARPSSTSRLVVNLYDLYARARYEAEVDKCRAARPRQSTRPHQG